MPENKKGKVVERKSIEKSSIKKKSDTRGILNESSSEQSFDRRGTVKLKEGTSKPRK